MTAQELAAEMHKFGIITFNRWAIDGAAMLIQQAEQIESLIKERDSLSREVALLERALINIHNNGVNWTGQTIVREALATTKETSYAPRGITE